MTVTIKSILLFLLLLHLSTLTYSKDNLTIEDAINAWRVNEHTPEIATYINTIESSISDSILYRAYILEKSKDAYEMLYGMLLEAYIRYNKSELNESEILSIALIDSLTANKNRARISDDYYKRIKYKIVNKLFYNQKRQGSIKKALHTLQTYGADLPQEKFYVNLAIVKSELNEFDAAIHYYQLHFNYLKQKKPKSDFDLANTYNSIGESYRDHYKLDKKMVNYIDSAQLYFFKAYETLKNNETHKEATTALYQLRSGRLDFFRNNYQSALNTFKACKLLPYFQKNNYAKASVNLSLAECYTHLHMPDSALFYLNEFSQGNTSTITSKAYIIIANNLYTINYESINQKSKAYDYAKLNLREIDSFTIDKQEASKLINHIELEAIKNNAEKLLSEERRSMIRIGGVSVLIILAILVLIIYLRKKKAQTIVSTQQNTSPIQEQDALNTIEDDLATTTENIETNFDSPLPNELNSTIPDSAKQDTALDEEWIVKIAEGLQKLEADKSYLSSEFKQDFVAKQLKTNKAYLSVYFNTHLNKTFNSYVNELRMQYVLQRLQDDEKFRNYSLQSIAETIGYKSINTFTKTFKEYTLMSPLAYINKIDNKATGS